MARKSDEPLQKHTIFFYEGDIQRLQDCYPEVGASIVVRKLVRRHLDKIEKAAGEVKVEVDDANF